MAGQSQGNPVIVTPPADPNVEYLPEPNWTLFRSLPRFDLRNGDIADVQPIFLKVTIQEMYYWVPIAGLSPADGVDAMDGFIKSHIQRVTANRPRDMSVEVARKVGIALGVARAVSTTYYRLSPEDITAGERVEPVLSAVREGDGSVKFQTVPGVAADVAQTLAGPLELTNTERAAVRALVKCSIGLIPMQGYSILMTGHHYLSQADSQAKKVYSVVERAYWRHTDIGTWFSDDLQAIQDALWHKACHPVNMRIKEVTAMDPDVATMIKAAGASACASRLPAMETELRAANSCLTLMATVAPMFEMCGGSVDTERLSELALVVKSLPVSDPAPPIPQETRNVWGPMLTSRKSGLTMLDAMLRRNQDRVAFAYGFYIAQSENNAAMGGGEAVSDDTLRTSFFLKKLKQQSFASWNAGYAAYGDYLAVRNKRRQEGCSKPPDSGAPMS